MKLSEYFDEVEEDEEDEKRRLAQEKSYEIIEHIDDINTRFDAVKRGNIVKSKTPSIFIGKSNYPNVPTGILSPIGNEQNAEKYTVDSKWYQRGLDIENVLQYRTGLLDSRKTSHIDVHDVWEDFTGVQREIAMAKNPVGVELGVSESANTDIALDDITSPRGPTAETGAAKLTENPYIPKPVEKTLEDDDWKAEGAVSYLYEKGFDVYEISQILSAGTLGQKDERKLVPTRWSITAVDDIIGKKLREEIKNNPSVDQTVVFKNTYMGNNYWVILTPGQWEYELVEIKDSGSIWNPHNSQIALSSAHETYTGRTSYVKETAGAYYAARVGALEYLRDIKRQGKVLILREVTENYWAPVGVWQIRESVRNSFETEPLQSQSFIHAVKDITNKKLPINLETLLKKSTMVAGVQRTLTDF